MGYPDSFTFSVILVFAPDIYLIRESNNKIGPKDYYPGSVLTFTDKDAKLTSRETSSGCRFDSIMEESVIKGQKRGESSNTMYFLDS